MLISANAKMTCEDCALLSDSVNQSHGDRALCPNCSKKYLPDMQSMTASETDSHSEHTTDTSSSYASDADICCTPDCVHDRRRDGRFIYIKCNWCMRDFHKRCLKDVTDQLMYACTDCRKMPTMIAEMAGAIHKLTKSVAHLNKVNGELIKEIHATQARCESMATANTELSNRVSELSQQLASRTWQGFNQSDTNAGKTCVIGSSIVRDVDPDKLVNTDVISISGGTIPMIHDTVNGLTNTYDRIILMVGGNDCDSHNNASRPVSDILEDYRLLIQDTKSKTHAVHVGSVCPCLKGQSVTDRIDFLNAGLQVMCNEEECTFIINNDESFKLSNGAANDGYLLSDKVHLSYCGTNRLAKIWH